VIEVLLDLNTNFDHLSSAHANQSQRCATANAFTEVSTNYSSHRILCSPRTPFILECCHSNFLARMEQTIRGGPIKLSNSSSTIDCHHSNKFATSCHLEGEAFQWYRWITFTTALMEWPDIRINVKMFQPTTLILAIGLAQLQEMITTRRFNRQI
jgi:hypothetical protein